MATDITERPVLTKPEGGPSAPPLSAVRPSADFFIRATLPIRAVAKSAIFLLKVFPMLLSRPVDWLTRPPEVERVRYPTRFGWTEGDLYRPATGGPHPGLLVCLGVVPAGVTHPQVARLERRSSSRQAALAGSAKRTMTCKL